MVSIRMIIKLGPKNELQTLGFRTYYNQCALLWMTPQNLIEINYRLQFFVARMALLQSTPI